MAVKPIIQYTGKLYVEILYECDIDIEHDITVILYKKIKKCGLQLLSNNSHYTTKNITKVVNTHIRNSHWVTSVIPEFPWAS